MSVGSFFFVFSLADDWMWKGKIDWPRGNEEKEFFSIFVPDSSCWTFLQFHVFHVWELKSEAVKSINESRVCSNRKFWPLESDVDFSMHGLMLKSQDVLS